MIDLDVTLFIQWGIYLALMVFLHFFLFKPVLRVIDARQARIKGTLAEADELRSQAVVNRREYEKKITAAKERVSVRSAALRESVAQETRKLLERAREEAMAQVEAAKERIRQDSKAVQRELQDNIGTLAREIAAKVLEREI